MKTIVSTKKIEKKLRDFIKINNIKLIENDFIKISKIKFTYSKDNKNWIFTSKNAVKSVFDSKNKFLLDLKKTNIYCVGESTEKLILKNGIKVTKKAENSMKLADFILKNAKNVIFTYFRGSIKNDDFSNFFIKNNIKLNEIQVYETKLYPKHLKDSYDGIMFFSPSGIRSFNLKNNIADVPCFCIGDTTSNYLKKFTDNIYTVKMPSIENVVRLAINHINNE